MIINFIGNDFHNMRCMFNIYNAKHVKKINICSMASNKMVRLVLVRK